MLANLNKISVLIVILAFIALPNLLVRAQETTEFELIYEQKEYQVGEEVPFAVRVANVGDDQFNAVRLEVFPGTGMVVTQLSRTELVLGLNKLVAGNYAHIDLGKIRAYFAEGDIIAVGKAKVTNIEGTVLSLDASNSKTADEPIKTTTVNQSAQEYMSLPTTDMPEEDGESATVEDQPTTDSDGNSTYFIIGAVAILGVSLILLLIVIRKLKANT